MRIEQPTCSTSGCAAASHVAARLSSSTTVSAAGGGPTGPSSSSPSPPPPPLPSAVDAGGPFKPLAPSSSDRAVIGTPGVNLPYAHGQGQSQGQAPVLPCFLSFRTLQQGGSAALRCTHASGTWVRTREASRFATAPLPASLTPRAAPVPCPPIPKNLVHAQDSVRVPPRPTHKRHAPGQPASFPSHTPEPRLHHDQYTALRHHTPYR